MEKGEPVSDELTPAKPPFRMVDPDKLILDADGGIVLSCSDIAPHCSLWKDEFNPGAMCPKCGRIYLRMEFATPEECGVKV